MMPFAHVSEIDDLVTDAPPPKAIADAIEQGGTELFVAPEINAIKTA